MRTQKGPRSAGPFVEPRCERLRGTNSGTDCRSHGRTYCGTDRRSHSRTYCGTNCRSYCWTYSGSNRGTNRRSDRRLYVRANAGLLFGSCQDGLLRSCSLIDKRLLLYRHSISSFGGLAGAFWQPALTEIHIAKRMPSCCGVHEQAAASHIQSLALWTMSRCEKAAAFAKTTGIKI